MSLWELCHGLRPRRGQLQQVRLPQSVSNVSVLLKLINRSGPLRIYRVLGSVAFLNSGTRLLKPILSNSQCWCVDGESKFVLQAGPHSYIRIELPNANAEDRAKVEEFKSTLGNVLQYETTPCPFKRGFTVDLPEKPATPVRRRPWRPRERPQPPPAIRRSEGLVRELRPWERPSTTAEQPYFADLRSEGEEETVGEYTDSIPEDSAESSGAGHDSERTDESELTPKNPTLHGKQDLDFCKTPTRPRTLKTGRATTAPPQLSLHTSAPSDTAGRSLTHQTCLKKHQACRPVLIPSTPSIRLSRLYRPHITFPSAHSRLIQTMTGALPFQKPGITREMTQSSL